MQKLYFPSPGSNTSEKFINDLYKINITPDNINVIHYLEDLHSKQEEKSFFASLTFYCQAFKTSGILGACAAFILATTTQVVDYNPSNNILMLMPAVMITCVILFSLINYVFFNPLTNQRKKILSASLEEEVWIIINIEPDKLEKVHAITKSKYPTIKLKPV